MEEVVANNSLETIRRFLNRGVWDNLDDLNDAVEFILNEMTLDEKLHLIYGKGFHAASLPRLAIPKLNMSDASMGMRQTPWPKEKGVEPGTAFPATLMLAASWNIELAYLYASSVAEEFRSRNVQVLLGPGVNIYRHPQCGRNFEYFGEDPFLTSQMACAYIKAVIKTGVMPVIKHFAANNCENKRKNCNSVVDERTLREIYFPAFKAAVVDGGVPGIMSAYNLLNGEYCGESQFLLNDILRDEWGFDGVVMSDWDSIWHTEKALKYGVDLEMPGEGQTDIFEPRKVKKLIDEGRVSVSDMDTKIRNILRPCLRLGLYGSDWAKPELSERAEIHSEIALRTAREGIVLLKNDALLPISVENRPNIVLIGPLALRTPTSGRGSGAVLSDNPVSLAEAFKRLYPNGTILRKFDEDQISKADAVVVCVGNNENFFIKDYRGGVSEKDSILEEQSTFNDSFSPKEGEGTDRPSFELSKSHIRLIEDCFSLNENIIVNIVAGSGVEMNTWIDKVKAVLFLFYPGQNGSFAAMEIIFGKVNPSGKLPFSIERHIEDNASNANFNIDWDDSSDMKQAGLRCYQDICYKECLMVGYRHFSTNNISPLFCFGHGLSYTEFEYSALRFSFGDALLKLSLKIKNIGDIAGYEIVQVYISDLESSSPRPLLELKAFSKIFLNSGEEEEIDFTLDVAAFSFWAENEQEWIFEDGEFEIKVGSSLEDIRLKYILTLEEQNFQK